ncbi:MAG: DUF423 domain-containing protein [Flavobacteriaceae bacterium]
MVLLAQVVGSLYGLLAVVFSAFGAHALKKSFSSDQLQSFETGVRYQMFHGILLLMLGFNFNLETPLERAMIYSFVLGVFLFSFSIYGLTYSASRGGKMKFLGPITPLGGLLLVSGWALLGYSFIRDLI